MTGDFMRYYEQERDCIDMFREEYEFLSNFYPAKMEFEGIAYYNSEGAYQAQKCKYPEDRLKFANMYADEAKKFGRKVEIREDWDEVKVELMTRIVEAKFTQHPELASRLLETGNKPLMEGNNGGDVFWGIDHRTGEGENHLGQILMNLRTKYREEGIQVSGKGYPVKTVGPIHGIVITDDDITQMDVQCIVNAANKTLLGGTGVDGAIHREAGPELLAECQTLNGCETGEVKITGGYNLKADYVIHAVGPVYGKDDEILLEKCYFNTLNLAKENHIHSIVFPALSTGKFCFPKKKAIEMGIQAVMNWQAQNQDYEIEIYFSCVDQRIFGYACEYLNNI